MIGVYGGTFDPIHYGHLRPALEVCEALALSQLRFIPCGEPAHRDKPVAAAVQRLAMVRAAVAPVEQFSVDERETVREGPSYMVDTLRSLCHELDDTPLCLVIGIDAFLGLRSWSRWGSLFELANLAVTHRPGWTQQDIQTDPQLETLVNERQTTADKLGRYKNGRIVFQPVTQLDIASTTIRQLCREGRDIRYLLPDSVYEIIYKQNIYR